MKRLILLAFFATPLSSPAQKAYSYFSLGPVGSIGTSWLSYWPGDGQSRLSGSYGLDLTYSRAENIGFGADLTISHEGFSADYPVSGMNRDLEVAPVYLRLQPKVIFFFNRWGDAVRPKIWVGPSVGLRLWENNDITPDRLLVVEDEDQELGTAVYSRADAGVTGGLGFNVRLANATWLSVGGAYYHGMVDVVDDQFTERDSYNRYLRFMLGVNFGLGISKARAHHRDAR